MNLCQTCLEFLHQSQNKKEHLSQAKPIGLKLQDCPFHEQRNLYVCTDCQEFCCFNCIIKNGNHFGHNAQLIEESISIMDHIKESPRRKVEDLSDTPKEKEEFKKDEQEIQIPLEQGLKVQEEHTIDEIKLQSSEESLKKGEVQTEEKSKDFPETTNIEETEKLEVKTYEVDRNVNDFENIQKNEVLQTNQEIPKNPCFIPLEKPQSQMEEAQKIEEDNNSYETKSKKEELKMEEEIPPVKQREEPLKTEPKLETSVNIIKIPKKQENDPESEEEITEVKSPTESDLESSPNESKPLKTEEKVKEPLQKTIDTLKNIKQVSDSPITKKDSFLRRLSMSFRGSPIAKEESPISSPSPNLNGKEPTLTKQNSLAKFFKRTSTSYNGSDSKPKEKNDNVDVNFPKLPEPKKPETLFSKIQRFSLVPKTINGTSKSPEMTPSPITPNTPLQEKMPKVFGADIEKVEIDQLNFPKVLMSLITRLRELNAKNIEGIFRISGQQDEIDKMKMGFEDDSIHISNCNDVHVLASSLKLYFRCLPTPLFPYEVYSRLLKVNDIETQEERLKEMKDIIIQMSLVRKNSLYILLDLLNEIEKNSKKNLMDAKNLSVVFAVNLIKPKQSLGTMEHFLESQKTAKVFEEYIVNYDKIQEIFL